MNIHSKRVFSIFSIIMILMFTIGQSLMPIIANAQELSTTGFVDSFTIDKTKLQYGEQTKLNVTFSDKSGNKMKSGDTLTLTLPPELQGYNATISLNDGQGNNFGTCQVNAGNVVCTFNDMVEKLHNIKGHFNFTVQASNVGTNQKKDVETNLGTTLNKQTVTIAGPTSGGGTGSKPFFSKVGDIQPNNTDEVRWFLNINSNKEYLGSDILVSDSLQEGQTLNKDSFKITIENSSIGRTTLSLQEFEAKGYGRIEVTNPTSFKVGIYRDKAHATSFVIHYTTAITESGKSQESFKNDYKVNYQILYKQPVSESGGAKVANITSGGGAQGDLPPKGTLRIVKHVEGNEGKFIPNVTFKLYKESNQQIGDTYTTGAQGIAEIPNLDSGNYYVQEINAPDYLDFDPQAKVSFTVDANAQKGVKLMIPNKVKTTSVSGTKTWKDDNVKDRPSMIKVDLVQNGQVITTQEVIEANGWNYTFANVPAYDNDGNAYTYTVKEQPVAGYQSDVHGYDITNTKVGQTKVEGTKTWKDDNAKDRPSMIKVDLVQNGQVVTTQEVTEANGWKYAFADLAAYDVDGRAYKYEVKEQPVAGYQSDVHGYDITNTKVGQTKVEGTKTWKDDDAKDRPSMIKVDLFQNGQKIDTKEVTEASGWKYAFADLAAYDADGKAYTYEVKEQPVAGYKSEVNGYDITNTKIKDGTVVVPDDDANKDPNNESNTDANKDPNKESNTDVDKDPNNESNADPNKDPSKESNADASADSNKESNTDANKDPNKESNTDANKDPNNESNMDVNKDPNNESNTDASADSNKELNNELNMNSSADPSKESNMDSNTNTSTNNDLKVPPTKENDKMTASLPKTGGTPMEFISMLVGMLLLVFAVFLFGRQRGQ